MVSGDFIFTIVLLGIVATPIIVGLFLLSAYRKSVKRAEQKLAIEKEQTFQLQQQVSALTNRVVKIETMLKEVD